MIGEQIGIRCVFMRGGTSRGCYVLDKDLPKNQELRDKIILRMYGSPDVRQIDGMGGGDPLTSKIAIIKPSQRTDADVEYTFGQVGIEQAKVSYGGNCGNILAGVGPFAVEQGLVPVNEPVTNVRIYNTNTNQIIHSEVQVIQGQARVLGDCSIAGVPGTGSLIRLNFMNCEGSMTGTLLPTGNPSDIITLDTGDVEVSLVDAATPFVFVEASSIGMKGDELPEEISSNKKFLEYLEQIRTWAARQVGVIKDGENATIKSPNVPRVAVVSHPRDYQSSTNETIVGSSINLIGRQMSMQKPHKTYSVTGAICTAVAANITGSVVQKVARNIGESGRVTIGHPSGTIEVEVSINKKGNQISVEKVALLRTARKLMEGTVYIPVDVWKC